MNRTFTLCFSLYPIALPFGYVLIYTFYHYAVPDANSNLTRIITGTVLSRSFDCAANSEIDLTFSKEFPSVPKEIFASITSKNNGLTSYEICSVSIISRSQYAIRLKCNYNADRKGDVVRCYYIAIL